MKSTHPTRTVKHRGYTIEPSGSNYRVRDSKGSYSEGGATSATMARKWIDQEISAQLLRRV